LVVFDTINEFVAKEAKRLNIPIIIITEKKLSFENELPIEFNRMWDIYTSPYDYDTIENIRKNSR